MTIVLILLLYIDTVLNTQYYFCELEESNSNGNSYEHDK